MWKVSKSKDNEAALAIFDSKVMAPIRRALDETSLIGVKAQLPALQLYERKVEYDAKQEKTSIFEELEKWYKKPHKKLLLQEKYRDTCDDLAGNILPKPHRLPAEIKLIFSKLAYFFLFEREALIEIGLSDFSRDRYISNIINSCNIEVCPYCDATTILNPELVHVEHYLSRVSYPLLSTNSDNLLICCLACNKRKSNSLPKNHHSPLITQHGDQIIFNLDGTSISLTSKLNETNEFIDLVKLRELYRRSGETLTLRICSEIADLMHNPDMLANMKKRRPHFFLKNHVVNVVENYPWLRPHYKPPYK
jgi:hypothetical protein